MFEIRGESNEENFTAEVTKAVGSLGKVQFVSRRVVLEIRDLDCLTQVEKVQEALKRVLVKSRTRKLTLLRPNRREMYPTVVIV